MNTRKTAPARDTEETDTGTHVYDVATAPRSSMSGTPPAQSFMEFLPYVESMMNQKVQVTEARTDVKIAGVEQKISDQTGQLIKWIIGTGVGGVVTILGLGIAIIAFGGDRFDGGMQGASLTVQQSQEAKRIAEQNAGQINQLTKAIQKRDGQIDALIEIMERRQRQ